MNFALVNPRVWAEIAVAALLAFGAWWAYNAVYDRGFEARDKIALKEKAEQDAQSIKNLADAAKTTRTLAATIDSQRSASNAQLSAVTAVAARAVAGLSDRAPRPSPGDLPVNPGNAGTTAGCTGEGLYRPDATFLIREAADAGRLRIALKACYAQYRETRKAVN